MKGWRKRHQGRCECSDIFLTSEETIWQICMQYNLTFFAESADCAAPRGGVNIDMSFMVYVAHQKGLQTEEEKARISHCMVGLELPVWHQDCTLALVQKSLSERLKHSAGSLRMPLPTGLGCAGLDIFPLGTPSGCLFISDSKYS